MDAMFERLAAMFAQRKSRLPDYVASVIESASVLIRDGEDGYSHRVFVVLGGPMNGAFEFTQDEATKRIRRRWPELTTGQVQRTVSFLESRVRLESTPAKQERRKKWIFDY